MTEFWKMKTLEQMNPEEWESLCDGCGLCCLVKIEDEESHKVYNTTISCRQLNIEACRCRDYKNRLSDVSMCTRLTLKNIAQLHWLPETCAYKRLYEDKPLPQWHPLITEDKETVHASGVSAKWFALSEEFVHPEQLMDFIIINNDDEK